MKKTGYLLTDDRLITEIGPAYCLTHADLFVLSRVASYPDGYYGTLRNLGILTMMRKESVARSLKKLVEKGLLIKEKNEENGRLTICYRCYQIINGALTKSQRGVNQKSTGNNINNNIENKKENLIKEKDGTEVPHDAAFNEVWRVMGRGDIDKAREEWQGLTEEDKQKVTRHIRHYVDQQKNYRQPLEKYLHNRLFDTMIYADGGGVRFDPNTPDIDYTREYCPSPDGNVYQKKDGRWYYGGVYVSSDDIRDGLTWDMRPDGQVIYLDREPFAKIVWNRTEKAFRRL